MVGIVGQLLGVGNSYRSFYCAQGVFSKIVIKLRNVPVLSIDKVN